MSPRIVDVTDVARLSRDLSRVGLYAVFDGSKPSTVEIWPREVEPFGLRLAFWDCVTEEVAEELRRLDEEFPQDGLAPDDKIVGGRARR